MATTTLFLFRYPMVLLTRLWYEGIDDGTINWVAATSNDGGWQHTRATALSLLRARGVGSCKANAKFDTSATYVEIVLKVLLRRATPSYKNESEFENLTPPTTRHLRLLHALWFLPSPCAAATLTLTSLHFCSFILAFATAARVLRTRKRATTDRLVEGPSIETGR